MRPIQLSVEGLTCFKEKQEIDFSGLDLFAISGPTGAGKSTLLDAILFALYGEVPRVGKQDLKEMISAARERVSVRFDFAVGTRRFRVARALRRKGAATVRLEEHDGTDFNTVLADQVRPASAEVTRLLGLDVDAFTQAVILPQGEFAKFLKADPRKRREMLRTLLRLDVYERMRQAAQDTSTRKKHELDALEQRLAEEYDGVSEAALAALQGELQQAEARLEERRKVSEAAESRLIEIRDRHAKTVELLKSEARLAELHGSAPQIDESRRELEAARRAEALIPLIDEADRAAQDADHARNAAQEARHANEAAARVHEEREGGAGTGPGAGGGDSRPACPPCQPRSDPRAPPRAHETRSRGWQETHPDRAARPGARTGQQPPGAARGRNRTTACLRGSGPRRARRHRLRRRIRRRTRPCPRSGDEAHDRPRTASGCEA